MRKEMKKIIIILLIIFAILSVPTAFAGFWSNVLSSMVANELTSSGKSSSGSSKNIDKGQTDEMKIQQALYGLGFFDGKLDGNLNTFDSRKAIKKLQKDYKQKESGILEGDHKQHLLYIHELYTLLIEMKEKDNIDKNRRSEIFDEIDNTIAKIKGGNSE
jgi:uncharacterized protein YpuA (DUF1002 family)